MGQTVNLLPSASVVRIHPLPPKRETLATLGKRVARVSFFLFGDCFIKALKSSENSSKYRQSVVKIFTDIVN
jgi:hypothetical protein